MTKDGCTALHYAVRKWKSNGYMDVIRALIDRQPDLNSITTSYKTVLETVFHKGCLAVVEFLLCFHIDEVKSSSNQQLLPYNMQLDNVQIISLLAEILFNGYHKEKNSIHNFRTD